MSFRNKIIALFTAAVALLIAMNNILLHRLAALADDAGFSPYLLSVAIVFPTVIIGYFMAEYLVRPIRGMLKRLQGEKMGRSVDELDAVAEHIDFIRQQMHQYQDELMNKSKQIDFYSHHDFLTGLPNRLLFKEQSRNALELSSGHEKPTAAVLFLDLDRFKIINDMFGHTKGDDLLRAVARRLLQHIRPNDIVSRIEGDEFVLLLPDSDREETMMTAQLLIDELSKSFVLEGNEFYVTPSMGISMFPDDGEDVETLVKHADTAMYLAKEQGRNHYRFYTSDMNERMTKQVELEKGLRKALERQELSVHYQPQVDLDSGRITGMEALLRWSHPELGNVSPAEFVPLAEENGMIVPIGEWILRKACLQNKEWLDAGLLPMRVAVNLSARQFQQQNLVEVVTRILDDTGMPAQYLDLEITESVAMFNEGLVIAKLHDLKSLGIKISIDDFGTGYSSLSYLKKFPIDSLKIDKSFVAHVMHDRDDAEIISMIISMARNLRFSVIAEGVENEEQLQFLRQQQCTEGQGYLFSKPMDPMELKPLLVKA
ncbi:EAL domain-containing protein [Paenibacillus sp. LMG 31456]|uniref:EAL domain-containing protein n=1 Tax=Paenibacillus foliorum TaxID=2654974 RepID=A0A972GK40_9BACL|nr:EAL domain-containing protein [Paenibacillus foliorum]NOU92187.1 EAL domain-containing protein [Paenibacillus foliorum]